MPRVRAAQCRGHPHGCCGRKTVDLPRHSVPEDDPGTDKGDDRHDALDDALNDAARGVRALGHARRLDRRESRDGGFERDQPQGADANVLLGEIAVQPNEAASSCRCEEPDVQRRSFRTLRKAAQEIDLLIERTAASK
jgi:hypothetical protein